ncbi:MAG: sulfatase [Synoicihabitans sp.]
MFRIRIFALSVIFTLVQSLAWADDSRPNIIVLLADDLRYDALEFTGHPVMKTPHLNTLAKNGVFFNRAFVTSSMCTPSRTSILTGQYDGRHGVTFGSKTVMTEQAFQKTYPAILRENGYLLGWVGKNHTPVGKSGDTYGFGTGVMESYFDFWYGNHNNMGFYPKERHDVYRDSSHDTQVEIMREAVLGFLEGDPPTVGGAATLPGRPDEQPFVLLINYNVPHFVGTGSMRQRDTDPELYRSVYRDRMEDLPIPETFVVYDEIVSPRHPPHVYANRYLRGYDFTKSRAALRERLVRETQTVSGIDVMVGEITATLRQLGLAENTIIIFASDHGIQYGEHGLGGKTLLYEESMRIPLVIHDPRIPETHRQSQRSQFALSIDIAPTVLELAGLEIPDHMQGRSLVPLLSHDSEVENLNWRSSIFLESTTIVQGYPAMEAVRTDRFKYIRYFDRKKQYPLHADALMASIRGEEPIFEELFDLQNDPQERQNLASDPDHRKTLLELRKHCQELVIAARGDGDLDVHIVPGDRYAEKSFTDWKDWD